MERLNYCLRLNNEVFNHDYDRRCKYGIKAHKWLPAGMLWVKRPPSESYLEDRVTVPKILTPEQRAQYLDEVRERLCSFITPLGTVDHPETKKQLLELSESAPPATTEELLFVADMPALDARQVFDHLMAHHGWPLSDIQRILSEIDQHGQAPHQDVAQA